MLSTHPVTVQAAAELPAVLVDPTLVERVLVSLVGNVAKHTPAETPIEVSARVIGNDVEFRVDDTGPGLPEGTEAQLFESFQRGDTQPTRKGAGLGLAISRAIVEAHGGRIRAERRPTGGASFAFTVPLKRAA